MRKNNLNIAIEKDILKNELQEWFSVIRKHLSKNPLSVNDQIELLNEIRKDIYEDLNQLQHKSAIILIAEELQKEFPSITEWYWHPKQTSQENYADLTGIVNDEVFLNAEITTSLNPVGTIDKRMKKTLESLNLKQGKKFYYVQTDKMMARALTKIKKNKELKVEVRKYKTCP